jgi:hypothetical protein
MKSQIGLWLVLLAISKLSDAANPEIHELRIVHPGDPERRNLKVVLEQHFDKKGEPTAYSTWVDSVICLEKTCEVVKVQLHWDVLGRYQRYNVATGYKLTKLDHIPFTQEDHAKLQRILLDKGSPLREVTKEGLIGKPKVEEGIDAVTRPTLLTLKDSVVIGAGYSCYDLWHWANGEVPQILRSLSGQALSLTALEKLLTAKEGTTIAFALDHLTQRKQFGHQTIEKVISSLQNGDTDLVDPALSYLKAAHPEDSDYYKTLTEVLDQSDEEKRVLLLRRLTENDERFPTGALDQLSSVLPKFASHHELHLFLNLVTQNKAESETISRNVAELLFHRKFFVARRAFWYLNDQDLPKDLQSKVDAFKEKHKERL